MDRQTELCQWLTPPGVAAAFTDWSRLDALDVILEPSAGEGALIPRDHRRVIAVELDLERIEELRYWRPQASILHANFLELEPRPLADVCIQNPPYSDSGEGIFIDRALDFAPRVCALVRTGALHGLDRYDVCWSRVSPTRIAYLKNRPKFLGPYGLPTPFTPAYDYVAIEAVRRVDNTPPRPEITWVDWR